MATGIDRTFMHCGIRTQDLEVINKLCVEKGLDPKIPQNYFPNDDPNEKPFHQWRSHAYLLYGNWLNYYVYQATPYNLDEIDLSFKPDRKGVSEDEELI